MSYNITNLKTDLQGILNVLDLSKVASINNIIERAARDVIADADPYELVRDVQISAPIYRDAYYYASPSDLKGNGIIDIYKQGDRSDDTSYFIHKTAFDARRYKDDQTFTVERLNGSLVLRINKTSENYAVIDNVQTTTGYTATANVSNLSKDTIQYISGGAALKFDLDAGSDPTTATVTSAIPSHDLTKYDNEGAFFMWFYLPVASSITSIGIDIGNDASNYFTSTETTTHDGNGFSNGWNLVRFDVFGSETGTVDITAIDYYAIDIVHDGTAQANIRMDYLTVTLGDFYRVKYYSKFMFTSIATGAFIEKITSDSDTINLDSDSYNLLLYKTGAYSIQSQHDFNYKPGDSESDRFEKEYQVRLKAYKRRYKSERLRKQVVYYDY